MSHLHWHGGVGLAIGYHAAKEFGGQASADTVQLAPAALLGSPAPVNSPNLTFDQTNDSFTFSLGESLTSGSSFMDNPVLNRNFASPPYHADCAAAHDCTGADTESSVTSVPEPSSVTLLGTALAGFALVRSRRNRNKTG